MEAKAKTILIVAILNTGENVSKHSTPQSERIPWRQTRA